MCKVKLDSENLGVRVVQDGYGQPRILIVQNGWVITPDGVEHKIVGDICFLNVWEIKALYENTDYDSPEQLIAIDLLNSMDVREAVRTAKMIMAVG